LTDGQTADIFRGNDNAQGRSDDKNGRPDAPGGGGGNGQGLRNDMLLRGLLSAAGIGAALAVSAGFLLGTATSKEYDVTPEGGTTSTIALAPISLGNPSTAREGLATETPQPAENDDPVTFQQKTVHQVFKARKGDTLVRLLGRAGAPAKEARTAVAALKGHFNPRRFRQGQEVRVNYRVDTSSADVDSPTPGAFIGYSLRPDLKREIRVVRTTDGKFTADAAERRLNKSLARAEGVIDSSLYMAGKRADLPNAALVELIRAFSWDVDFQRDIRKGDSFQVMYERTHDEEGLLVKSDTILFATLALSGKHHTIYRFKGDDGHINYFNEKGHSARKALMRTPIDGARLSSGYGRRKHPILGYTRMHRGVDFAAPRGTPIYAAGNGTVTYAGRKGGYGKYIRIRHNSEYSTAYAHLNGYARGVRKGKRINQGQIIGYVGSTGRSTGPHLHYEIMKGGRQVNPLRVRMPSGRKLKGDELQRFLSERARTDERFAAIETGRRLADAD